MMTNNEPKEKRDYDMKNTKNDMAWLLPALIGLITIGALAYYLMHRPKVVEKAALPTTTESVIPTTPVIPVK